MLSAPSKFQTTGEFVRFFIPSLTGMVGFWATVALNIPDFTRYAKSQRAQALGQALGLPAAMTLYSFIGVAVTSASVVLFGEAIWDPVVLLGRFNQPVVAFIALVALLIATLNTNVAANVVSPVQRFFEPESAADFVSHRRPDHRRHRRSDDALEAAERFQRVHFRLAGGILGPARSDRGSHDRRLFRGARRELDVDDLYRRDGVYDIRAVSTGAPWARWPRESPWRCCGLVFPPLRWLYDYAWFVGFGVAGVVYLALMRGRR